MPLAQAVGGILAHSLRRDGITFKKGQILGPAELAALAEAGVAEVTVAQLDAGDIEEDEAARRVAGAVKSQGVVEGAAGTGRVNLFASRPGLLSFRPAAIDALNAVTEDVTLATFPLLAPVETGRMVATVKIIPFAVPRAVLARCVAAGGGAAIVVHPFRPLSARLIQTVSVELKPSIIAKTSAVTADRMAHIGGRIAGETRCPHDVDRLAADIAAALEAGCDILLVIGASAIVDRRDVIPAAIEACGGRIGLCPIPGAQRFGLGAGTACRRPPGNAGRRRPHGRRRPADRSGRGEGLSLGSPRYCSRQASPGVGAVTTNCSRLSTGGR